MHPTFTPGILRERVCMLPTVPGPGGHGAVPHPGHLLPRHRHHVQLLQGGADCHQGGFCKIAGEVSKMQNI